MTQGNNRISERSPGGDPVLMVQQKPEASNQTNDSLQQTFASKAVWAKLCCVTHCSFHSEFYFLFSFGVGARAEGRYGGMGG